MCGTIEWRRRDLGKAGEIAKIELSTSTTSHITLPFLAAGPSGPIHFDYVLTRAELEREAARNVEVMWLTGRLVPDHKTIADFRKDNGTAIRKVCARFIALCRMIGLLTHPQRRDRRQQVQGGEQPRQELHPRQDGAADDHAGLPEHSRWRARPYCLPLSLHEQLDQLVPPARATG